MTVRAGVNLGPAAAGAASAAAAEPAARAPDAPSSFLRPWALVRVIMAERGRLPRQRGGRHEYRRCEQAAAARKTGIASVEMHCNVLQCACMPLALHGGWLPRRQSVGKQCNQLPCRRDCAFIVQSSSACTELNWGSSCCNALCSMLAAAAAEHGRVPPAATALLLAVAHLNTNLGVCRLMHAAGKMCAFG